MRGLESGKEKVKKICEALKKETLDPAKHEAEVLIINARQQAEGILVDAKRQAQQIIEEARQSAEQLRATVQASLLKACNQTLESLKEKIEKKLFNAELGKLLDKPLQNPKMLAELITAVVKAIEKEGLEADISASISSAVPAKEVNQLLTSEILQRLREKGVLLSPMGGGVQVKIVQNHMTIDLSDAAFKELVAAYIRKDFRELVFGK